MNQARNKGKYVNLALHIIGFSLCIVPPLVCTLSYFPLWKNAGYSYCIAGGTALLLVLCFFPLLKFVGRAISSYGSYIVWLLCFVIFYSLSKIADQMTVISLIGFMGNLAGTVCFKIAKRRHDERE